MQEANTTQHFNSISTVGLSVLEGVPEVKGAVDQGCGFKGEETKFWKGCGSGIKDGLSLVSISTAETMIQDPIQHMQKAFGSKKGLRRNPCISKGARTLKQLGKASADRVVADPKALQSLCTSHRAYSPLSTRLWFKKQTPTRSQVPELQPLTRSS